MMLRGLSRGLVSALVLAFVGLGVSGCGFFGFFGGGQREPWRAAISDRCMATGAVRPSAAIQPRPPVDGPGICGADRAFRVTAFADGKVGLAERETLDCPMIAAIDQWLTQSVQPAALALYGQPVVGLRTAGSYACRGRNGASKGPLSEHAFANALDVAAFVFADGGEIAVETNWRGDGRAQTFLRAVHRGGCASFFTVIGPDGDRHHQDHLHLDLARYGMRGQIHRYCR